MNRLAKRILISTLSFISSTALASPGFLITHNQTNFESNSSVAGKASPEPTKANQDGHVHWAVVRMICYKHVQNGFCSAMVQMATNTPNPIDIGIVSVNIETGEIYPKVLRANGFTLTVNGPGETTIRQD